MEKKKIEKNTAKPVQKIRLYIQISFAALCLWIGVEFWLFLRHFETSGHSPFISRPPGVDGFLPISSLMSVYYFLQTGEIHWAHPAGFFIFLAIVLVSLVAGKSFCSWLCPVGFISEMVGDFGQKIFRRKIKLPQILDYPLRSLKYLLLFFFVYSIFFTMDAVALKLFLDSPYNQLADVKMYYFFADISRFSITVIAILSLASIVIKNFWCRYLCPYGALLGIVSFLSPLRIKRNVDTCIDCDKCNKACPSFINVAKAKTVLSDECTSCMSCVDACPVKNTLRVRSVTGKKSISSRALAVIIVILFMIITGIGMLTGNWQNGIKKEDYKKHIENINSSDFGHPGM